MTNPPATPDHPDHDRPTCRTCGVPIDPTTETFPFCSTRCRNADLGKWFNESYRISREVKDSDLETVD